MLQEELLAFPDLVPAVTSGPQIQGEGKQSAPLAVLLGMWRIHTEEEHVGWEILCTVLTVFGMYHLPCTGLQQQGQVLAPTRSAVDPGNSPEQVSRWLSNTSCCFHLAASLYQLMIPHPLLQGKSSNGDHIPALRCQQLEWTSRLTWPCLNLVEQARPSCVPRKKLEMLATGSNVYHSLRDIA